MITDPFFFYAVMAGIGLALAAGPLGCFVIWRRMAYFGDATAHAAILGVALSLALSLPILAGVLLCAVLMALGVSSLGGRIFAVDTLLGVASHAALAIGIVAVALTGQQSVSLEAFLFGDILSVTITDLWLVWGGAIAILCGLIWRWSALLTATLSGELAHAQGIDPQREQVILTLALAILVAIAIKVVGALLITALLIIPAATARLLSATPERMAVLATIIAVLSMLGGLELSFILDTPSGPTVVSAASAGFAGALIASFLRRKRLFLRKKIPSHHETSLGKHHTS